jgi:hypothetical protein
MSAALKPAEAPRSVFMVAVENVMPLWPQWEPLLIRALRGAETHDALDVRRMVLGEQAHLWVQWAGRLEAFVVTEFAHYPKGTWLRLWLTAAAPDCEQDTTMTEDALAVWKDAHNCRGYEVIGRMGWLRRFPEMRFVGAVMRTTT